MGFFSSSDPSIEMVPEQDEQIAARSFLMRLLKRGTPNIPTLGTADMSDAERAGQSLLMRYLSESPRGYEDAMRHLEETVAGGYDPRTGDYWKGFREESRMDEEEAVADLRRGAQFGGMYYSEPSMRTEATLRSRFGAGRSKLLGELYDAERNRMGAAVPQLMEGGQMPARQAETAMRLGGLPRQLDQAREDARYNTLLQRVMFPYTQKRGIAESIWQMKPDYWIKPGKASGFSQLMSGAESMLGLFEQAKGLFGGGGGGNYSLTGQSPTGRYDSRYEWGGVPAPWGNR